MMPWTEYCSQYVWQTAAPAAVDVTGSTDCTCLNLHLPQFFSCIPGPVKFLVPALLCFHDALFVCLPVNMNDLQVFPDYFLPCLVSNPHAIARTPCCIHSMQL